MKNLLLILFCVQLSFHSTAQCIANAGEDIHRCSSDSVVVLGGNPTATNGSGPYTYEWWIDPIPTGSQVVPYIYASDMLNDTSLANPSLIYLGSTLGSSITFFLRITDSSGCQNTDTMEVTTSIFNIHLGIEDYWIDAGDSVFLNFTPNISGGYGTITYDWNPSYGLSDTTLPYGFWASPDTSTAYTLTITDSKGCTATAGGPLYYVWVNTSGIYENNQVQVKLYPNPTTDALFIKHEEDYTITKAEVYSLTGKKFHTVLNPKDRIDLSSLPNGVYFMKFYFHEGISVEKIVKR